MPKSKQQIDAEVAKRGLVSVMNDTKWRELQNAIRSELPFAPTYQLKAVCNPEPHPGQFEPGVNYLGDWSDESLFPFYEIDWIRICPLFLDRPLWKRTEPPEGRSIERELLAILHRYHIPYRRDDGSIWIFGYTSSADDLKSGITCRWSEGG